MHNEETFHPFQMANHHCIGEMASLPNIKVFAPRKMKIGMETNMRLGMGEEAGMGMGRRYG